MMNTDNSSAPSTQRQQRAEELRRILQAPSEKELAAKELAELERQEREEREQAGRKAAAERCKAISRAVGSALASMDDDEQRVAAAAKEYADAVGRLNARFAQLTTLAAESAALTDRFAGIAGAKLPPVLPPNRREASIAAARLTMIAEFSDYKTIGSATEMCEHRMRRRRTYAEIGGTPAFEIISRAGLHDFAALTDLQEQMVSARKRELEEEQRSARAIASEVAETKTALGLVHGAGMRG